MEFVTSLLARFANPPLHVTDEPGFNARVAGYLWWKRVEITELAWRSPYRHAVLAHEMFHFEHCHSELTLLMFFVSFTASLFCAAAGDWGRLALEACAFVACMVAWCWWREFAADFGAVRAGFGPDLARLYARQRDSMDSVLSHPIGPARVAYVNWLARRYG